MISHNNKDVKIKEKFEINQNFEMSFDRMTRNSEINIAQNFEISQTSEIIIISNISEL